MCYADADDAVCFGGESGDKVETEGETATEGERARFRFFWTWSRHQNTKIPTGNLIA
jgi:hypothetical protein